MNTTQTKELYESGNCICYCTDKNHVAYGKVVLDLIATSINFEDETYVKVKQGQHILYKNSFSLIHKKDEAIANAVIANSNVEVEIFKYKGKTTSGWNLHLLDFFKNYQPTATYRLKSLKQNFTEALEIIKRNGIDTGSPTDPLSELNNFNGGYIKASQEAYDLLVEAGCKDNTGNFSGKYKYLDILNNIIYETNLTMYPSKQFYINNGALSWDEPIDYCTCANSRGVDNTTNKCITCSKQLRSEWENPKVEDKELTYEEARKPLHGVNEDVFNCKNCGNYINELFENPNCSGCSKNPFYINCFTPLKPKGNENEN